MEDLSGEKAGFPGWLQCELAGQPFHSHGTDAFQGWIWVVGTLLQL